jgi:pyridoxamine 5'-phosphate oxidase family protein
VTTRQEGPGALSTQMRGPFPRSAHFYHFCVLYAHFVLAIGSAAPEDNDVVMTVFTEAELLYLAEQRLARLATASKDGQPDVSVVGFGIDGDTVVSGGLDLTKTVRFRHLQGNPRATLVIDDLASVDPWAPRGVKVRGRAVLEQDGEGWRIRVTPDTVWSWGINKGAATHFAGMIEKRTVAGGTTSP